MRCVSISRRNSSRGVRGGSLPPPGGRASGPAADGRPSMAASACATSASPKSASDGESSAPCPAGGPGRGSGRQLTGPLLATAAGGRLRQGHLWELVRRLARTRVGAWEQLSPHCLRHSAITFAQFGRQAPPCATCRTTPATKIPAPPAGTTTPATAWTATPPTPSLPTWRDSIASLRHAFLHRLCRDRPYRAVTGLERGLDGVGALAALTCTDAITPWRLQSPPRARARRAP